MKNFIELNNGKRRIISEALHELLMRISDMPDEDPAKDAHDKRIIDELLADVEP